MNSSLKDLYILQQIDSRIAVLTKQYHALNNGSTLKAAFDVAHAEHESFQSSLKKLQRDIKDAELEVANIETKEKEYEKNLYGGKISNPKELGAMEKEIESLKKQRSRIDEKILVMMDELEALKGKEKAITAQVKETENELHKREQEYKQEVSILAIEGRKLKAERSKLAPLINPELLHKYETLRAGKGGIGIGKIEIESCSVCHTSLHSSLIRRLKDSDEILTCDNCGRILCITD